MSSVVSLCNRRALCVAALLSSTLLLLSGCVSSNRTALAPTAKAELRSVDVAATVSQPELAADVNRSNVAAVTGGGLIAALIDVGIEASRAKKAEKTITVVRDSLVDFSAPEELRRAIETELGSEAPLPVCGVRLVQVKDDAAVLKALDPKADSVLVISTDYRLSPNFSTIRVLANVRLLSRKQGKDAPLYRNDFATYRHLPVALGADNEATAALWAENNGAHARAAMQACFAELAAMIKFDLQQGSEANLVAKEALTTQAPAAGRLANLQAGYVRGAYAKRTDDRTWVRLMTGELSSTE